MMHTRHNAVQLTRAVPAISFGLTHLGPWCGGAHMGISLSGVDAVAAIHIRKKVYARALSHLSSWLNQVHNLNNGERFWEIIVFRFLNHYVDEMTCRFLFAKQALASQPDMRPVVLHADDYETVHSDADIFSAFDTSD